MDRTVYWNKKFKFWIFYLLASYYKIIVPPPAMAYDPMQFNFFGATQGIHPTNLNYNITSLLTYYNIIMFVNFSIANRAYQPRLNYVFS